VKGLVTAPARLLAAVVCGLVLLLPRIADACPVCANKEPGGTARIAALGVMILLPFAIGFVVVKVLRNADKEPAKEIDS
jgi:hypothetical protein